LRQEGLYLSSFQYGKQSGNDFRWQSLFGFNQDERAHLSQGEKEENAMASNRGVAYMGTGKVEIHSIDFPKLALGSRKCEHGVILKIVSTNICGSDQHMVRGRTTAPTGLILGHEITGEIIEAGRDVEFLKVGDLVSVPFNIACGRCRNCKERATGVCLSVNPARPGAAYGYVDMGGWVGGQAEYVMVPYADFNLLKFPNKAQAMEKIRDLTCLSDILPTGFHGAVSAGVGPGSTVYIAGAGPVGLASAAGAQLLGAACVIVGDLIPERLAQAKSFGCEVVDVSKSASVAEQIEAIVGVPEVDCAVDCVGFEARGHGQDSAKEAPATVLNSLMEITRAAGALGIPGLYVTGDPGGIDDNAKVGRLSIRIGLGWAKSHVFTTGQCPVMKYNRQLMQAILYGKIKIAKAVNVQVITLDQAPQGYKDFDKGAAKKFVLDPHGMVSRN
jgi:glutathione-independent formaldehyde dehydrogenase